MLENVKKEIKRLKNLKNYRNKSEQEIEKVATLNIKLKEFKKFPLFADQEKQELAEERYKTYLENHEIESLSDLDNLRSLVYNEILESSIQKSINQLVSEKKYPPEKLTKQLTDLQNQKNALKIKLGIDREKEQDELTGLQILKQRFDKYINENRHEFTVVSPSGEMSLLRRRVKDFEVMEHPWFVGRWLCNLEIVKDVQKGKLSKQDATRYLMASGKGKNSLLKEHHEYCEDYIDYLLKNWDRISEHLPS